MELYMDDEVVVEGRVLRWGNSYGVRISKADLERAGLKEGSKAIVRVRAGKVDLSHVTFLRGGRARPDDSMRHDELLGEALEKRYRARR